jgi:hypothetical protein
VAWYEEGERQITFLYPSSSMRAPSKVNRAAEKYDRIGIENPMVGIALNCKRGSLFRYVVNEKEMALPPGYYLG